MTSRSTRLLQDRGDSVLGKGRSDLVVPVLDVAPRSTPALIRAHFAFT